MEKIDGGKLKKEVQEQIRYQAIRLRKAGKKYREIEEVLSVSRTTICTWYKKYEREGKKGIKTKKRGRKPGEFRTLNSETFIKFLKRPIKDANQKIFLILDNLRVHHEPCVFITPMASKIG